MNRVGAFLKESKSWLGLREPRLCFVVGNESCDLDSAMSAICLAYFYARAPRQPPSITSQNSRCFVPVMNIDRVNLPLKTEVTHLMRSHDIDAADLVCRNELPQDLLGHCRFILVDHHIATSLTPIENIIQVIDHRPLDSRFNVPDSCAVTVDQVGSCATLITKIIKDLELLPQFVDILPLLHGPIVLDTVNFSPSADKTKPLDIEMNKEIEQLLNLNETDRLEIFNDLVIARNDVSSLTALELLSKDLKVIVSSDKSTAVAIPGFPILAEDFLSRKDAWDSLKEFGNVHHCDLIVLMGMLVMKNGDVRRDLAIIAINPTKLANATFDILAINNADLLQLERKRLDLNGSIVFEQKNIKASRKQILPLLQSMLE